VSTPLPVQGGHSVPKPTVEEIGARVQSGGTGPLGSGLYLVPADDRWFSEHGVPDPVGRERRLALGARWLGVGREGYRRLRRLRAAEQQHHRQFPVQATRAQTRAVSGRPLGAQERSPLVQPANAATLQLGRPASFRRAAKPSGEPRQCRWIPSGPARRTTPRSTRATMIASSA